MKRFVTISTWNGVVGILAIAMFAAVLSVASPANAAIVNVDWMGHAGGPAYVGLAGAPDAVGNTTWNSIITPTAPDSNFYGDLLYSDGSVSGVGIQNALLGTGYRAAANGWNLFEGYTSLATYSIPAAVTWTGLNPDALYDVYLYSSHPWGVGSVANFTVNGVTQTVTMGTNVSSFVLGDNYVKFASQSPAGVYLQVVLSGDGTLPPMFSGMQLVEVPEPGTLALLTANLVGLLAYAWRKRR